MRRLLPIVCLAAFAACQGSPEPDPLAPRVVRQVDAWSVVRGDETLGRMRLVEIDDARGPIRRFYVDNASGKLCGYIDDDGRVYRFELFETEERFDGMYPMREGVARLLEVDGAVAIVGRDGEPAEAAARGAK